jgi:hypothetical protein
MRAIKLWIKSVGGAVIGVQLRAEGAQSAPRTVRKPEDAPVSIGIGVTPCFPRER